MAFKITNTANNLKNQIEVKPQIILEIDGIPFRFGTADVLKYPTFDEGYDFDTGLFFDTPIVDPDSRAYISIKEGTSSRIFSQLIPDKGGAGSVQSFKLALVNKNRELTPYFTSGNNVPDILGRDAKVYLGFVGGVYPQDFIKIFDGFIDNFEVAHNLFTVSVAIPTQRVRQKLFNVISAKLTESITPETIATFNGPVSGMSGTIILSSNTYGDGGNSIELVGNGSTDLDTLLSNWNSSNPFNATLLSGDGSETPNNGAVMDLQGGGVTVVDIPVDATAGFVIPTVEQEENLISYIKIGDELIKLSQTNTATDFLSVARAQLNTAASSHEDDSEVTSFIRLLGNPITLALRLLLSQPKEEYYVFNETVIKFVKASDVTTIRNAIFFNFDIFEKYNVLEGDLVNISGASEAANNFTGRLISQIGLTSTGSYIVVTGDTLILELETSAVIDIKSQFNTMPVGIGMIPNYVDLTGILELYTLLGGSLPNIDIYVKDSIDSKEWLEKEIFKIVGLFALNRKGRYSIYAALPPLNSGNTVFLNETTITNITSIKVKRSTEKNHYNAIVYKFEQDSLEDDFKGGLVIASEESINRIPVGNKQLTIEAAGLRDSTDSRTAINRQAQRSIDKYRYAPQYIEGLETNFRTGYTLEVGDTVVFGGEGVLLPNTETGTDYFPETLMEITNKSISIKSGIISFNLINSAFGLGGRFGVIAPSSYTLSSSSNTLTLKRSFATTILDLETEKWEEFIGRKVRLRDANFTKEQILTLKSVAIDIENKLVFEEVITIAVNEDDLLDLPEYDEVDNYTRNSYVYLNPEETVTAVTSTLIIEADPTNLFEGALVRLHNDTYSNESQDVLVDDITGNVITFSEALNYLPIAGDSISLIGFVSGEGLPYRYL